ncbi:MAG: hypothetical protein ACFE9T_12220 [Promethearchaeota archaeon]
MSGSVVISIFQKINIAELNSLSLFDFENSLKTYFSDESSSNFCQRYFKWFEYTKFDKTNNSFLNEFDKWFYDFFS